MAAAKIPSIVDSHIELVEIDTGIFRYNADTFKRSDIFLNVPASTASHTRLYADEDERGYIAARNAFEKCWEAVDVFAVKFRGYVVIDTPLFSTAHYDKLALGVDSRMKLEDVNGATIVKEVGGKWIFAHATEEEHHNRMLAAEAAMSTVFDALIQNSISRALTLIVKDRPSNQELGALTVWEHITDFRHDCMRMARYLEGQLTIGDHVKDPENHDIYDMLQKAFELTEKKWKVEKAQTLNAIDDHIAPIKKRLSSRHNFEYRWEKPTVFPNASRTAAPEESGESS